MWGNRNKPNCPGKSEAVVIKVVGGNNFIDDDPFIANEFGLGMNPPPQEIRLVAVMGKAQWFDLILHFMYIWFFRPYDLTTDFPPAHFIFLSHFLPFCPLYPIAPFPPAIFPRP